LNSVVTKINDTVTKSWGSGRETIKINLSAISRIIFNPSSSESCDDPSGGGDLAHFAVAIVSDKQIPIGVSIHVLGKAESGGSCLTEKQDMVMVIIGWWV
jgi:hypothetical protein